MYLREHQAFFRGIRSGETINNGDYMVNSTRIALMGRQAAYGGKTLGWSEAINDPTVLGPSEYVWGDVPEPPVAIPGRQDEA